MDLELRDITDDEFPAYSRVIEAAFGQQPTDEEVADAAALTEGEHRWAAFDQGEIVATGGAFAFDLTLPGGASVPAGGLTAIGVRTTHRRRGILTSMMDLHLDEAARRGQPLSILTASESVIYGRFGYGSAADLARWRLPTQGTTLAFPPRVGGRLRQIDGERAATVLPEVYEAHRAATPGALSRKPAFWGHWLRDRPDLREGASARFYVQHETDAGRPDGYAAYRLKPSWGDHGLPAGTLVATEVLGADAEVEAALWEHLLSVDLVTTIEAANRPVGDPVRWRLADPRRLQTEHVGDHLWVRLLDIGAALEARSYLVPDVLVLELTDPFRPVNSGRWRLEAGPGGATCSRTEDAADVSLGVADLGAAYLGGVRPSTLARAGRVQERTPGALARLDLLLSWSVEPWCATAF